MGGILSERKDFLDGEGCSDARYFSWTLEGSYLLGLCLGMFSLLASFS